MEQKHILLSALGAGIGVGVGLGLASGQSLSKWNTSDPYNVVTLEKVVYEMLKCVVDGKESDVTFDQFPYYLSEQTRVVLTSAAFVHLQQAEFSKHTRNLSPASQSILLSGPAELYQQLLGKALAHYFEAKLLLLDATDFSLKIKNKYGNVSKKETSLKRSISEAALERFSGFLGSFSSTVNKHDMEGTLRRQSSGIDIASRAIDIFPNTSVLRRNASASDNISTFSLQQAPSRHVPLKRTSSWLFDEKLFVQGLYRVIVSVTKTNPLILYLRDVDKLILKSSRIYTLFSKVMRRIPGRVLILGSRVMDSDQDYREVDEKLHALFPYNLEIKPPADERHLVNWKSKLEEDMKIIQFQDTKNHIVEVLAANDLECDDLDSICLSDTVVLGQYIEEVVVSAISYHLMNNKDPQYRNGKLIISSKSLSHGLSIFQEGPDQAAKEETGQTVKSEAEAGPLTSKNKTEAEIAASSGKKDEDNSLAASKEVPPDNEFEKRIRPDVISANELNVTFADVGALDEVKESLQELVILPLRRPDLFKGGLLKPCRGILLFGPPGTGKTMLAKAIAKEAGASFINVSMSTITSKWFGEDEKNVRALFSLSSKVAPSIIFIDEVDSMLGQRTRVGEHEAMRKIKNEFMTHWDGLLTGPHEQILVLAATNRPFDLDEAIIRRFERRIMVGLPSVESREMILRTLLSKEKVSKGVEYRELATMTEGYSGSDLKNLCTTAAYRPVRELIQEERKKDLEKVASHGEECNGKRVITLRPLNMEDFRSAKDQVAASFAAEGSIMSELKQWNDLYGEGGSRKKQHLSYFL